MNEDLSRTGCVYMIGRSNLFHNCLALVLVYWPDYKTLAQNEQNRPNQKSELHYQFWSRMKADVVIKRCMMFLREIPVVFKLLA